MRAGVPTPTTTPKSSPVHVLISDSLPDDCYAVLAGDAGMAVRQGSFGGIKLGDALIISHGTKPKRGDIVLASINDGDPILREYVPLGRGCCTLVPTDTSHATAAINRHSPGVILGVVVEHRVKRAK